MISINNGNAIRIKPLETSVIVTEEYMPRPPSPPSPPMVGAILQKAYFFWKNLFTFTFAACPFSRSSGLNRGVGGTSSSILARPPRPLTGPPFTELGNSVLRGVSAVTTFRADFRMVSRIFHSRFFAT